jgi:hypothetical protein
MAGAEVVDGCGSEIGAVAVESGTGVEADTGRTGSAEGLESGASVETAEGVAVVVESVFGAGEVSAAA